MFLAHEPLLSSSFAASLIQLGLQNVSPTLATFLQVRGRSPDMTRCALDLSVTVLQGTFQHDSCPRRCVRLQYRGRPIIQVPGPRI